MEIKSFTLQAFKHTGFVNNSFSIPFLKYCFITANVMVILQQKEEQQGSETGSSSEDQLSETELGIEELQLLLQAMQFRRSVIPQNSENKPWGSYFSKALFEGLISGGAYLWREICVSTSIGLAL